MLHSPKINYHLAFNLATYVSKIKTYLQWINQKFQALLPQIDIKCWILGWFEITNILEKVNIHQIETDSMAKAPSGPMETFSWPLFPKIIVHGELQLLYGGDVVNYALMKAAWGYWQKAAFLEQEIKIIETTYLEPLLPSLKFKTLLK
jgi:hypothetical protein